MAKAKAAPAKAAPAAAAKPKKASSKPKVDFKELLLQHGERIGIGSAAGLTLLLVVLWLCMPGSGLFSGSPTEKASTLDKVSLAVESELKNPNNLPTEADKPPADSDKKRVDLDTTTLDGKPYQITNLVPPPDVTDMGRRQPKIENIVEARGAVARVQVRTLLFARGEPLRVFVLKGKEGTGAGTTGMMTGEGGKGAGKGGAPGMAGAGMRGGMPGMGGGMMGGMRGGMMGMGGMMGGPGGGGDIFAQLKKERDARKKGPNLFGGAPDLGKSEDGKEDKQVIPVLVKDLAKHSDKSLAVQVRPLRMAIIAASFPYKAQVEEFRRKLGLRTEQEVLSEASTTMTKGQAQYAFRFAGVLVQRRELDIDGKPMPGTDGQWTELNLNEDYKPYVVLTDRDFEPDDPALAAVSFTGLTMPRLRQFGSEIAQTASSGMGGYGAMSGGALPGTPGVPGGGKAGPGAVGGTPGGGDGEGDKGKKAERKLEDQYPPIEKELPKLKEALDKLKDKTVAAPASDRFKLAKEFDIFSPQAGSAKAGTPGVGVGEGMLPGEAGSMDDSSTGGGKQGAGAYMTPKGAELPEHCLVRLVDVTVQPGRTYEYRLKVRMANPNYQRRDVASMTYRQNEFLESPEWSKLAEPIVVPVDRELTYYAIDQMQVEKHEAESKSSGGKAPKYTGPYKNTPLMAGQQVFLQAHRWIESIPSHNPNEPTEVGEWVVAERIPVFRGEYVGRSERVEMPVWRFAREDFVLAGNTTSKTAPGISVNFGYNQRGDLPEAVLLDFETPGQTYNRVVSRVDDKVETKKANDSSAGEVLLLTPEGKLILRETARDAADEARKMRVEKVRKRVQDIKDASKGDKDKKGGGFGDGGGAGGDGT